MRGRLAPGVKYFVSISLFRVAKRRQGLDGGGDVVRRPPLLSLLFVQNDASGQDFVEQNSG